MAITSAITYPLPPNPVVGGRIINTDARAILFEVGGGDADAAPPPEWGQLWPRGK